MTIAEGETINFVDESRARRTGRHRLVRPDDRRVVVVPGSAVAQGRRYPARRAAGGRGSLECGRTPTWWASAGGAAARRVPLGRRANAFAVVPARRGGRRGRRARDKDALTARVKLWKKGTEQEAVPTGAAGRTELRVAPPDVLLRRPAVTVDGRAYTLAAAAQRDDKPYTVRLLEFKHELYPGTHTPKDYASTVRLTDPPRRTGNSAFT